MNNDRAVRVFWMTAFIATFVIILLYRGLGHYLVEYMYNGRSIPLQNSLVAGQASHGLESYTRGADRAFMKCILVLWGIIFLMFFSLWTPGKKGLGPFKPALITGVISALFMMETILWLMLTFPSFPRMGIGDTIKDIYHFKWNMIQAEPGMHRYDPELIYTLMPGEFIFSNAEFKTKYRVNSEGVRDDEESLSAPEIIVLGDSVPMGWGVEQEESFPQLIENKTGKKVLNASVSSYSTVREMRMLDRLDVSGLEYLIIYYSWTDWGENKAFFDNGNTLPVRPEDAYKQMLELYKSDRIYYPGRYTVLAVRDLKNDFLRRVAESRGEKAPDEIDRPRFPAYFLNSIMSAGRTDLNGVKLIVVVDDGPGFADGLREEIARGEYPGFIRDMEIVDLEDIIRKEHVMVIDTHYNAKGHEAIADKLTELIKPSGK